MLDVALGTFVTYNPQAIACDMPIGEALSLMCELGIHHLPVVDDDHRVMGIVSHCDLQRSISGRAGRQFGGTDGRSLPVERVMVRSVFTIDHLAPPKAALEAILNHGIHSVPVLEDGTLVGMITSTDFLRELSYGEWSICSDSVADYMVTLSGEDLLFSAATEVEAQADETAVLTVEQSLGTAAGLMLEFNVREIAVVNNSGEPIGILRDDDILQAIAEVL